jgi:hypothetical protein
MQVICKKCSKDVTMEVEFQIKPPFGVINNHECEVELDKARVRALEAGFIL